MSRRSAAWFGKYDQDGFIHRTWMRNQGFASDLFDGRPVIGIANSWSELTPCNAHLRELAEAVKCGVWEDGGWSLEFPTICLGEPLMRPATMLYRNLMSMDVETSIRANPLDGVVLLSGCDKTTPAQLMGEASVDLPSLQLTGRPMLNGKCRGREIGPGTDVWRLDDDRRTGVISTDDLVEAESCFSYSHGHGMTMGTASTMACIVEGLGIALSSSASLPAVDARLFALAQAAGRRIVAMVNEALTLSRILTREAFENAIRVVSAIGGSSNAVVHLIAIAGRVGVPLTLADFDRLSRDVPLLVDLMPAGRFLIEDFAYAGGLPAVVRELGDLLHQDTLTATRATVAENVANAACWNREIIRERTNPLRRDAGMDLAPRWVATGPLAPVDIVNLNLLRDVATILTPTLENGTMVDDIESLIKRGRCGTLTGAGFRQWETGDVERAVAAPSQSYAYATALHEKAVLSTDRRNQSLLPSSTP